MVDTGIRTVGEMKMNAMYHLVEIPGQKKTAGTRFTAMVFVFLVLLSGCRPSKPEVDGAGLRHQVLDTERAFAHSMAVRDYEAFASFISDEAMFFSNGHWLHGKSQISSSWKQFFQGPDAPFSWEPEHVAVLDSGTLALSTGPVLDPKGNQIGTFTSIWRQEAPGRWRIIFDRGNPYCGNPDKANN